MRKIALITLCFLTVNLSFAQESANDSIKNPWHFWFNIGVNFNGVGLINWDAGGDPMLSLVSKNTVFGQYDGPKFDWDAQLDVQYGFNYMPDEDEYEYRKSMDFITFKNNFDYKLGKGWSASNATFFQTQFTTGYSYNTDSSVVTRDKETNFMAPGYFNTSLGVKYNWENIIKVGIYPAAYKMTAVLDPFVQSLNKYAGINENGIASSFGYTITNWIRYTFWEERAYVMNEINFFGDYLDFENIQVFWNTGFGIRVWDVLNFEFSTNLIYDASLNIEKDDGSIGRAVQFKHSYLVGIGYLFDNIEHQKKKAEKAKKDM